MSADVYDKDLRQRLVLLVRAWEANAKQSVIDDETSETAYYQCAVDLREALDAYDRPAEKIRITDDTTRCLDSTCSLRDSCARYLARNDGGGGYVPRVQTLRTGKGAECGFHIDVAEVSA